MYYLYVLSILRKSSTWMGAPGRGRCSLWSVITLGSADSGGHAKRPAFFLTDILGPALPLARLALVCRDADNPFPRGK